MIQEFHKCEPEVATTTPEDDDTTEDTYSEGHPRDRGWSSGFGGLPGLQPDVQVDEANLQ